MAKKNLFAAPQARPHALGPHAVEIDDPEFVSVFVLVGEVVYLKQPYPVDVAESDPLIVLGRSAALRLAETIIGSSRAASR